MIKKSLNFGLQVRAQELERRIAARLDNAALVSSFACLYCVVILFFVYAAWLEVAAVWGGEHVGIVPFVRYTAWLWPITLIGATGAFIAWRWILITSSHFSCVGGHQCNLCDV